MPPFPPGGPNEATIAEQDRQNQQDQAGPGAVAPADPRRLSEGGRDLLNLQQDLTRSLGRTYQDPQGAFSNLVRDGQQRISNEDIRSDPRLLGPLREGVTPDERTTDGYLAGRDSYDRSTPQAREEVSAFSQQEGARQAQTQAVDHTRDKSLTSNMNNSLVQSMTSQQSLSL